MIEKTQCILIHGGPLNEIKGEINHSLEKDHWFLWVKENLENKEIETFLPSFPNPSNPLYDEWEKVINKFTLNQNTILIGHSRGCAFLLRYLMKNKVKIEKLILVSPNLKTESENSTIKEFYNFDFDKTIDSLVEEIIIFSSDNEDKSQNYAKEKINSILNVRIIELKNKGHFISSEMDSDEFPEIIKVILNN